MSEIKVGQLQFSGDTDISILQNASATSDVIKLKTIGPNGFFGLELVTVSAGGGTIKAEVLVCSTEDGTFTTPEDKDGTAIDEIVTAHAAGQKYYGLPAFPVAPYLKIKFTENNVAAVTSLQARIIIQ